MTTEELLAMPDDGIERWLIDGRLREKKKDMTKRNGWHSRVMSRLSQLIGEWLDRQPEPRGEVLSGEAGCRLRRDPDTAVGIDVVYISPELASDPSADTTMIDGVPTLVVEIQSPSDTNEETNEKIDAYLKAGVPVVWIVDPHQETVNVYQPKAAPEMFNVHDELSADRHLPGFRVPVAKIFKR
jgi:Uma2 family endonuclease